MSSADKEPKVLPQSVTTFDKTWTSCCFEITLSGGFFKLSRLDYCSKGWLIFRGVVVVGMIVTSAVGNSPVWTLYRGCLDIPWFDSETKQLKLNKTCESFTNLEIFPKKLKSMHRIAYQCWNNTFDPHTAKSCLIKSEKLSMHLILWWNSLLNLSKKADKGQVRQFCTHTPRSCIWRISMNVKWHWNKAWMKPPLIFSFVPFESFLLWRNWLFE